MTLSLDKVVKGVAGAIVLVVLLVMVLRWWGDYRIAAVEAGLPEVTSTATPGTTPQGEGTTSTATTSGTTKKAGDKTTDSAETPAEGTQTVVVLIEGLNFREKADRGSKAIRALSKGEKVALLQTIDSWYQVKDADGEVGWISSNPAYAKLEK